ncbi:Uncharacterized protein family (UPF0172) [Arabidopsis thaliana]|uniref:Uncharacterized protein family (UPF0172) n=1 Tax=Arabidopsis thaliana TaxID=3702 RepID=Q3E8D1_ARATH|nr:Uncharacterized protein family (UPF0172) [Arabidopsis thaliana]AED96105.2 Uncharacterized protein family (UPF0172) [Arabidopsis thaliana]|eukprot:NP_001318780.1 Uncharacterized protein family (UPF0172) [Arabidopsis thaliana]
MIEEHYVAQGLSIVGYFHANERFDDVELCGVAKNIGDHISRYFPQAPILLVSKCLILCLWNALARQEAKGCEYPVFRASLRLMLRSPKSLKKGSGATISGLHQCLTPICYLFDREYSCAILSRL